MILDGELGFSGSAPKTSAASTSEVGCEALKTPTPRPHAVLFPVPVARVAPNAAGPTPAALVPVADRPLAAGTFASAVAREGAVAGGVILDGELGFSGSAPKTSAASTSEVGCGAAKTPTPRPPAVLFPSPPVAQFAPNQCLK